MTELVAKINAAKALPPIAINPKLAPSKKIEKKEGSIGVEIREDGTYWLGDQEVKRENLVEVLKAALLKVEKKDPKAEPVLQIRAAKELEFKYARRVIKAGAAAGIKQVAYASFAKEE